MLCNTLIKPHFDYACVAWLCNLHVKLKKNLQKMQNNCIHFCVKLDNPEDFKTVNWLSVDERVH